MNRWEPVLQRLRRDHTRTAQVTHVESQTNSPGVREDCPGWASPAVVERMVKSGVAKPWSHQVRAANLAHSGSNVIIATGISSGKSLGFLLPCTAAIAEGGSVLYLAPTKALAADQERKLAELALPGVRAAVYDGDTPMEERSWARAHANYVLTNPDMLHRSIVARHPVWAGFLRRLSYVVVDEAHHYRGVFGSHVAQILRRLRRVCGCYGAEPRFILASATTATPAETAQQLTGLPVVAVTGDGSARASLRFALVEPELTEKTGEQGAPLRRTATAVAAELLADLVSHEVSTLVFVRSRQAAELVALAAQRALADAGRPELARRVAAYRGGYLAEDRRRLEQRLRSGELLGLATTNALELGVDVSGLDAVVLAGWPGTRASLWQQGARRPSAVTLRVRRTGRSADTYLVHHPDAIFGQDVKRRSWTRTTPICSPRTLCAAAEELPLAPEELPIFVERVRCGCRAGGPRAAAPPPSRLVLDASERAHLADIRGRAGPVRSWTKTAACWAPWTRPRRARPCIPARSTCTKGSAMWSPRWTWSGSPWCAAKTPATAPGRGRSPTSTSSPPRAGAVGKPQCASGKCGWPAKW